MTAAHRKLNELKVPTVHLNGTSGKELTQQLIDAHEAIRKAVDALHAAMPHDRDYYVQPDPGAGQIARDQMRDRIQKLEDIDAELIHVCLAI